VPQIEFLAQLLRSEPAIRYVHPTQRELESIGITKLLSAAGGVDNRGCLLPMYFLRCMHPDLETARKEIWERPDQDGRIARRQTSVGHLVGKASDKHHSPIRSWQLVWGYWGLPNSISKQDGWRAAMDGDVSHFATGASLFCFALCFIQIVFFFTSGAPSPEWVKPAAEGGSLFLLFLAFCVSLISTMLT
jgi:hypothetical protein